MKPVTILRRCLHSGKVLTTITDHKGNPVTLRELLELADGLLERAKTAEAAGEVKAATRMMRDHESVMAQYRALERMEARPSGTANPPADSPVYRASLGAIVRAVLEGVPTDGAEAELQRELGLGAHHVPLELIQTRAVTAPPANVGVNQFGIVSMLFPQGLAEFLGIEKPTVPVGEAVYPVLTAGAVPAAVAKDADAAESDGAFSANKLEPGRLQTSFRFRREDLATFRGLEDALRENLSEALSSALDDEILYGTNGLLNDGLGTAPAAPTDIATYGDFLDGLVGQVDGLYASTPRSLRLVVGAETYERAENVVHVALQHPETAYEMLLRRSNGGVMVNSRVKAAATVGAVTSVQDALVARRTDATHAVAPLWQGVQLVRDEVTKVLSGQIVLTAVSLFAFAVLRTDGFARLRFKTAA